MEKKPKKNYQDLFSGLVIMAFAAFFYYTTLGTRSFVSGAGSMKPDTIPKIVAVIMFIIGIIIIAQWAIKFRAGTLPPAKVDDDSENRAGMTEAQVKTRDLFQKITMPVTLVLIFFYIFLMSRIGFCISTFFFLTFQITLLSTDLSAKSWIKYAVVSLIATFIIYVIFGCAFALAVPKISFIDLGIGSLYRSIFG